MKRMVGLLVFLAVVASADNSNLRRSYNYSGTNSGTKSGAQGANYTGAQSASEDIIGTKAFVGVGVGAYITDLRYSEKNGNATYNSKSSETTYGGALNAGISHMDRYIGGRFYGEVNYFGLSIADVIGLGLNLDLLVNFVYSKNWHLGGFAGIGGGMYVGLLKSHLNPSGKVDLSVAGWVNAGLRVAFFNHAIELAYRFPYTFASIYNYTTTTLGADGSQSYNESYKIKAHSITLFYVFNF